MQKQFQYKSTNISYNIHGKGKAVVLIHGFAEDSEVWNEQVNFLQKNCQLIIPDLPGSGKSGFLSEENAVIEDYAKIINALLENEQINNCIMIGHSMGGYVTLAFADLFPGKLNGFGFVHSTAFADDEKKKEARAKGIKFIEEHGVYSFLKNTTPNLFAQKFKDEQPEKISELIEKGKLFTKEALIQYYRIMINRPDRTNVLTNSNVPVLFVIGTEDVAAPMQDLLQQVHLPKVSDIHIIKEAGHMSMLEKPLELNEKLLQFINFTQNS